MAPRPLKNRHQRYWIYADTLDGCCGRITCSVLSEQQQYHQQQLLLGISIHLYNIYSFFHSLIRGGGAAAEGSGGAGAEHSHLYIFIFEGAELLLVNELDCIGGHKVLYVR